MTVTPAAVREARRLAAMSHATALGSLSACALSKAGTPFPAGKFWEGQTAALSELLRSRTDDLGVEAARLLGVWRVRAVPGTPRDTEAYRAGGVEALSAFADG